MSSFGESGLQMAIESSLGSIDIKFPSSRIQGEPDTNTSLAFISTLSSDLENLNEW